MMANALLAYLAVAVGDLDTPERHEWDLCTLADIALAGVVLRLPHRSRSLLKNPTSASVNPIRYWFWAISR